LFFFVLFHVHYLFFRYLSKTTNYIFQNFHLFQMADQIMDTTDNNNSLLSNNEDNDDDDDDQLEKGSRYWGKEFEPKDNIINENDWSSSDDDDDDDKEITYHHKEPSNLKNLDWYQVPHFVWDITWQPTNRHVHRELHYYKEKIRSIRRQLADDNLILRPIYKGIGYHLDSIHIFQRKVSEFIAQTSCYSFVSNLSRFYSHPSHHRLADIVEQVETTLDNLFHSKSITETQYKMMKIDRTLVRMNYLYFVSETHKVCIFILLFFSYILSSYIYMYLSTGRNTCSADHEM
jgi:hypothetical protein